MRPAETASRPTEAALANLREAVELYPEQVAQPQIESTPFVTSFQIASAA